MNYLDFKKSLDFKLENIQITHLKLETILDSKNKLYWNNLAKHPTKPDHYLICGDFDLHTEYVLLHYCEETKQLTVEIDVYKFLFGKHAIKEINYIDFEDIEYALAEYLGVELYSAGIAEFDVCVTHYTNNPNYLKLVRDEQTESFIEVESGVITNRVEIESEYPSLFGYVLELSLRVKGTALLYGNELLLFLALRKQEMRSFEKIFIYTYKKLIDRALNRNDLYNQQISYVKLYEINIPNVWWHVLKVHPN